MRDGDQKGKEGEGDNGEEGEYRGREEKVRGGEDRRGKDGRRGEGEEMIKREVLLRAKERRYEGMRRVEIGRN